MNTTTIATIAGIAIPDSSLAETRPNSSATSVIPASLAARGPRRLFRIQKRQAPWPEGSMKPSRHMFHTQMKGRIDMKPTRTRLVWMAAALSTIAIAAPVSTAGAATAAPSATPVAIVSTGPDDSPAVTLPTPGQAGTVTGARFITNGSATFAHTTVVTSSGDASVGG